MRIVVPAVEVPDHGDFHGIGGIQREPHALHTVLIGEMRAEVTVGDQRSAGIERVEQLPSHAAEFVFQVSHGTITAMYFSEFE